MGRKVVVVGGVAGGASFAARMRRLDERIEIVMFDKGEYVSFANCGLPYFVGGVIAEREKLIVQTPKALRARYNIDIRTLSEVVAVDTAARQVTVTSAGRTYTESFDYLVLAPGAKPILPPIKGIDHPRVMTVRSIPDTDRIAAAAAAPGVSRAVVIGGGFIGLEMAENLRMKGLEVTLVELANQVFAPADREMAAMVHEQLRAHGVTLKLGDSVEEVIGSAGQALALRLRSGGVLQTDIVVAGLGVAPDTGFLKGSGIALNQRGAIIVDEHLSTNVSGVYAVGDAVEVTDLVSRARVSVPLAGPANRQARIVADTIAGKQTSYKDTQGTAICKVFDLTVAVTGLNEKTAQRAGMAYRKVYTHSPSHASYYPGATELSLKLIFAPDSGRLLGAQVAGREGVDKRIDVLATALRHGLTVSDLSELELAYAPPFGNAKDAVNIAGFAAQNILDGDVTPCYPEDIASVNPATETLLDVRTPREHAAGAIPDSVLIPVNELRERLGELDKAKPVTVYCQIGLRGYVAARLLQQHGFRVRNLSGGFRTYQYYTTDLHGQ